MLSNFTNFCNQMSSIFKNIPIKNKKNKNKFTETLKKFYDKFSFVRLREKKPRKINIIIASFLALIGIFIVYQITASAYRFLKDFQIQDLFFAFSDELKTDEHGYTNFLLLGRGGGTHDGAELTDTMIVASFDKQTESLVMLSIPRDFYVQTEYYGSSRINEIARNVKSRLMKQNKYSESEAEKEGIKTLTNKIEDIVELDIQYYAMIDFTGFKAVVDALDGIDVDVPANIYDTTYPADTGWGYQTFSIKKGLQHLDGSMALKYARSRHTTSDFDRALRQQQVIQAIKTKGLELKTLTSPTKIRKLYESIEQNFQTDMSLGELISVAKLAANLPSERMLSKVLVDEPTMEGGFLATPPRENYGGAFVLIPYSGDMEEIHRYTRLLFQNREIYLEKAKIAIQNGTSYAGIANKIATRLNRYSIEVREISNTPQKEKYQKSKIVFINSENFPVTALVLPMLITAETEFKTETGTLITESRTESGAETQVEVETNRPDIILILGDDFEKVTQKLVTPYY